MYIPLPERPDREILLRTLLKKNVHSLSDEEITKLSSATHGYSGADLKALCTDASMGPIRDLGARAMEVAAEDVPPISYKHFRRSLKGMNPSVSEEDLNDYIKFNDTYGNNPGKDDDDDASCEADDLRVRVLYCVVHEADGIQWKGGRCSIRCDCGAVAVYTTTTAAPTTAERSDMAQASVVYSVVGEGEA